MQVEVKEICMCTEFGGCSLFGFRDLLLFKFGQNFVVGNGINSSSAVIIRVL